MDNTTEGRNPDPSLPSGSNPDNGSGVGPTEDNPNKPNNPGEVGGWSPDDEDTVKIPLDPDIPEHPGWIRKDE